MPATETSADTSNKALIITVDGPSASGKSSVARRVAQVLNLPFVSSGLVYRGATYQAMRYGVNPDDEGALMSMLEAHPIQLVPNRRGNRLLADGKDVTEQLHTREVDALVSAVSRHPKVRGYVYQRVRELSPPFVVEGRDMGRVVFPDAAYKFYLTARPEVRAHRRSPERDGDLETILAEIIRRDQADIAQSIPAADAITLDTSEMSLEEVVNEVISRTRTRQ